MSISAKLVKDLREKSGAGMMECKKALVEVGGDIEKAMDYLRKKGADIAAKKSTRDTGDGSVFSYIHPGNKVGVMVEVNCETDFVARNPEFLDMCKDIAMHIAAASPRYVSSDDVNQAILDKEREILTAQVAESGKPANIIQKIVDGRINKFYEEYCLLEQVFVKDTSKKVKDVLVEKIAKLGENMTVSRFIRYKVGEDE
jgi:elongation factor Ts